MTTEQEARLLRAVKEYKTMLPKVARGSQHTLLKRVADMHMITSETLLVAVEYDKKLREKKRGKTRK